MGRSMGTAPVRAVILAAGLGYRLRPLTDARPKCLVELCGATLLQRQLRVLRDSGLTDVTVVTGHGEATVNEPGIRKIRNPAYDRTNMVASLFCARDLLDGTADLIVAYGDIVYERRVLAGLLASRHQIAVCVDRGWRRYWDLRMEDPLKDAETLRLGAGGRILELGKKPRSYDEIEGQYVGLFRIAAGAAAAVVTLYEELDRLARYDGRAFEQMFMTSFLQEMIDRDFDVGAALIENGWLEVDTMADLELYQRLATRGELASLYDERR